MKFVLNIGTSTVCPSYHHTTRLPDYLSRLKRRHLLRFQVQNLEKAGILNKTKVSENGKKVRWAET